MYRITPHLYDQIRHFAAFPQTGVSLQQMVQFGSTPSDGTLFKASQFLGDELPIRLAHRVKELEELPDRLNEMPSIQKVKLWYAQSFEELVTLPKPTLSADLRQLIAKAGNGNAIPEAKPNPSLIPDLRNGKYHNGRTSVPVSNRHDIPFPPEISAYNEKFTKTLSIIKRRHDAVVATIAQGILEYKKSRQRSQIDSSIQSFLDRFYMSRIGIRMLIGQHIALTTEPPRTDYVGIICTRTNIRQLCSEAIENARFICEDYYGLYESPRVQLVCDPDLSFMYVPGHLSHMTFEIMKNSLRAVVEKHGINASSFPLIKVVVAKGNEDITVKISDEGGGIPRSAMPLVWTYMYTTAHEQDLAADFDKSDFKAPMAGFGYGLPISRLYARYFGGDLILISMEGYGTDVYLHLNRLSSSSEPLA
ncbi:[Pyruvate dehydrogenase (acetyl-transferring)] kinase, mitochondrial [Neolecta irregularis DAH-3]|uniref:Protein-serine/threonine kinase n=1 Tax=Neolecta irregularis (strain DAH-3) TaxID=1198029 RepID=A0A1U7LS22_NEOID|nr:[Pyruvate dehydrogenase (acetyl-transferring)] kinase, mitochondrial [Neolecta irregularis DAH-3]|eukprot:OLL25342.1 [Pyruvate dehydrogenase (acetyl-transferring)] kinase, mitochondrial [Neolecta irregularis DAH-3]